MATQNRDGPAVFKVKLGECLSGPSKRLARDLHDAGAAANRVRLAVSRRWQRHHEDNPGLEACCDNALARVLYEHGRQLEPSLAGQVVSQLVRGVLSRLQARTPRDHRGREPYRWRAILAGELPLDCPREPKLPLQVNAGMALAFEGRTSKALEGPAGEFLQAQSVSAALLRMPLFSRDSGRKVLSPVCRLRVGQLGDGHRNLLRRLASGEWKLCDSTLTFDGKHWLALLCYRAPVVNLGLSLGKVATLWPGLPQAGRPFRVGSETGPEWGCGNGMLYLDESRRLRMRRNELTERYRCQDSGRRGHGFKKFFASYRPYSRANERGQGVLHWKVIAELVRYCKRYDCGTVHYREPGRVCRVSEWNWFWLREVSFDWTSFRQKLEYRLHQLGIRLEVIPLSVGECRGVKPDPRTFSRAVSASGKKPSGGKERPASRRKRA